MEFRSTKKYLLNLNNLTKVSLKYFKKFLKIKNVSCHFFKLNKLREIKIKDLKKLIKNSLLLLSICKQLKNTK
jgi:hypothetical protein